MNTANSLAHFKCARIVGALTLELRPAALRPLIADFVFELALIGIKAQARRRTTIVDPTRFSARVAPNLNG